MELLTFVWSQSAVDTWNTHLCLSLSLTHTHTHTNALVQPHVSLACAWRIDRRQLSCLAHVFVRKTAVNGRDWAEKSLPQYYLPPPVRSGSQLNGRLQSARPIVLAARGMKHVWLPVCLSERICVRTGVMKASDPCDNSIQSCDRRN